MLLMMLISFPLQITTGEACICRWPRTGECQEVMFRHLTVSIITNRQIMHVHNFFKNPHNTLDHLRPESRRFMKTHLLLFLFPGLLQMKSVKSGHIVIRGLSSSLFLCVDSGGHLRGQVSEQTTALIFWSLLTIHWQLTSTSVVTFQAHYTEADCTFQELLLADGYTRFLSSHHGFPVSLASRHPPGRHSVPFTRFLPLRNTLTLESVSEQPPSSQKYFNLDSDDPFEMGRSSLISPQFSAGKKRKWIA